MHQCKLTELSPEERKEEGICRAGMMLARIYGFNDYEFVDGVLKYNDLDTKMSPDYVIDKGRYLLFAILDPTRTRSLIPKISSVSIYS